MRIVKTDTAGVIIDMQEKLLPHMKKQPTVLENCVKLITGLNLLEVPVLATQQYTRGLGETVEHIREVFEPFDYIEKTSFSCCDEPEFNVRLKSTGKHFVIIAGIETHVCVLQTVIDLINFGYQPVVIENCVSSRFDEDKDSAIHRMRQEGAIISTYESVLFELTQDAKADAFKAISKLVK
ncbi:hydrolase [Saccharicrinis sp. FJH54]|uniref:hydrolase n=1 Tax=Saccharicrinis sp. FJH54 TaxID=3344665 RepID=UPI0035D4335B